MTRIINLQAQITDDGRVFIQAPPNSPDVTGLHHLLPPNDELKRIILSVVQINDEARGKGPKPQSSS